MKQLAIFILAFAMMVLAVPIAQAAPVSGASLDGFQFYQDDNIWNVPVDSLPVDSHSAAYIGANYLGVTGSKLHMAIAEDFPINIVDQTTPRRYLTSFAPSLKAVSDNIPYPIPTNALVGAGSDHPMIMVDKDANMLYELYDANQNRDGTWWAECGVVFNLSSYTLRPDGWPSTSASGLPMAPGLLRYDEVASGSINHALHINFPTTGYAHIWPARAGGNIQSASYPPLGQRFRLKQSFDISGFNAHQKVILTAMKKYGVILADNEGPAPYFSLGAVNDARWGSDIGYLAFQSVHLSDFEAVDVSSLMINKDSGQARITLSSNPTPAATPTPTKTPSLTVTSPDGGESWVMGSNPQIRWTSSGDVGSSIKIELLKVGTVVQTITSSTANDLALDIWTMSSGLATGTDYQIRVTSTSNPAITDTSNGNFAITSGTTQAASITVTSPNGGESWTRGTSQPITWSYTGSPGSKVKIVLLQGDTTVSTIASSVSIGSGGTGSYTSTMSKYRTTGNNYKISIQSTSQPTIQDMSNNYFTIS